MHYIVYASIAALMRLVIIERVILAIEQAETFCDKVINIWCNSRTKVSASDMECIIIPYLIIKQGVGEA